MPRYHDRLTHPLPTTGDLLRILLEGGFTGRRAAGEADLVPREPGPVLPAPMRGGATLTWIGHATFVIQAGGLRIATDPVWSDRIPGGVRRLVPPALPLDDVLPLDAVTVSHNHYDHLDAGTFRRLPKTTAVFCPIGLGRWFRRRGFADVHELDWWQAVELRGVRFSFVPAHHWSRRTPWDTNRSLWGGWVVEHGGLRMHHAGDTGYGPWFKQIRQRVGPIDVAMLPIGAYAPRWFMRSVHMDPDEAVQAAIDLGARHLAAMHWGTFVLTREPVLEPLERVRADWEQARLPRNALWDLPIGGSRSLLPESPRRPAAAPPAAAHAAGAAPARVLSRPPRPGVRR